MTHHHDNLPHLIVNGLGSNDGLADGEVTLVNAARLGHGVGVVDTPEGRGQPVRGILDATAVQLEPEYTKVKFAISFLLTVTENLIYMNY